VLYREGELSVQAIADHLGIAKTTLYSYLRHRSVEISAYRGCKGSLNNKCPVGASRRPSGKARKGAHTRCM